MKKYYFGDTVFKDLNYSFCTGDLITFKINDKRKFFIITGNELIEIDNKDTVEISEVKK